MTPSPRDILVIAKRLRRRFSRPVYVRMRLTSQDGILLKAQYNSGERISAIYSRTIVPGYGGWFTARAGLVGRLDRTSRLQFLPRVQFLAEAARGLTQAFHLLWLLAHGVNHKGGSVGIVRQPIRKIQNV